MEEADAVPLEQVRSDPRRREVPQQQAQQVQQVQQAQQPRTHDNMVYEPAVQQQYAAQYEPQYLNSSAGGQMLPAALDACRYSALSGAITMAAIFVVLKLRLGHDGWLSCAGVALVAAYVFHVLAPII